MEDGEYTEEEGTGGEGGKRVRLDERACLRYEAEREREGELELPWDAGVGGGVGRLTG